MEAGNLAIKNKKFLAKFKQMKGIANMLAKSSSFKISFLLLQLFLYLFLLLHCNGDPIIIQVDEKENAKQKAFSIETVGKGPALNFGVTPFWDDDSKIRRAYAPFIHYLAEQLDRKIRLIIASDYKQLISFMKEGKIHFGNFSTSTFYKANEELGSKLLYIATSINRKSSAQSPFYRGAIFVKSSSAAKKIKQLKGKKFVFTQKESASGYRYPLMTLLQNGLKPKKDFKKILFVGGHRASMEAVLNGKAYGGAALKDLVQRYNKNNNNELRILKTTEAIPNDAICLGMNFPSSLRIKFLKVLLGINKKTKNNRNELVANIENKFPYIGWTVKSKSFYNIIGKVNTIVNKYDKKK